ncbi:uncharacterized protein V6R79_021924 [Siganus canaliculatus]
MKGLADKFLGCTRLLTPTGTLYALSDKLRQIHEPTGKIPPRDMIHLVGQYKCTDSMERGSNGWRGATSGKGWERINNGHQIEMETVIGVKSFDLTPALSPYVGLLNIPR